MANGRVQVQGVGSAPKLQAVVNAGGQYRVQTQQAGRNKLMDLAESLSQVGMIGKEYGALGEVQADIGRQNAATVSDADVMKELKNSDPDTFFTIKRQRAFRNTLLKRAISNNLLPSMQAEADTLLDLDKYKNQNEFMGAVNGFLDTNWESFSEEVGGEVANSDAAKVLWNSVTGPFKNNMLKEYGKKMDAFNLAGQQAQLGIQLEMHGRRQIDAVTQRPLRFDPSGLQEIAQQRENLLIEDGVLDKTTRNKVIVQAFATQLDSLYAAGRYEDADRMLSAMKVIQVKGKPIFRTTTAKSIINPIESKLNTKLNQSDVETDTKKGKRFGNKVVSAMAGLRRISERGDASQATIHEIRDTFIQLNPSLTEEQVEEMVDGVFTGSGNPLTVYREALRSLANNGGDAADKLYFDNSDDIDRGYQIAETRPITASAIPEDVKEDILNDFRKWHSYNPTKGWQDFLRETDQNVAPFDALKDESDKLTAGNYVLDTTYYKNLETRLEDQIKEVEEAFKLDRTPLAGIGLGNSFREAVLPRVQNRLVEKAKELASEPDADKRSEALQTYANGLLQEERERFQGRAEASLNIMNALDETEIKGLESVKPESRKLKEKDSPFNPFDGGPFIYQSIKPNANPSRSLIEGDRLEMVKAKERRHLGVSLYRYGFDKYSKDSPALLEMASPSMDAGDVRLFKDQSELNTIMRTWGNVLRKDELGEKLTDTEKATLDEFQKFGVYDGATFDLFYALQKNLFN